MQNSYLQKNLKKNGYEIDIDNFIIKKCINNNNNNNCTTKIYKTHNFNTIDSHNLAKNKPASKTINKTVNNNFICVFPLGSEPNNVISQENLKQIIVKNGLNSILEIVKRKHFNPALPQCQSFIIDARCVCLAPTQWLYASTRS